MGSHTFCSFTKRVLFLKFSGLFSKVKAYYYYYMPYLLDLVSKVKNESALNVRKNQHGNETSEFANTEVLDKIDFCNNATRNWYSHTFSRHE